MKEQREMPEAIRPAIEAEWKRLGRPGLRPLLRSLRRQGVRATQKDVQDFLKSQSSQQVFRGRLRKEGRIAAGGVNQRWQADLLERTSRSATGARYALVAVDIFSRLTAAVPMGDKTAGETWRAFMAIVERMRGKPRVLETDPGGEFDGVFARNLSEQGIAHVEKDPRSRNSLAIVDTAIQKLKVAIGKEAVDEGDSDWEAALRRAVAAVNARPMDAVMGEAPEDVQKNPELHYALKAERGQEMLQETRATAKQEEALRSAGKFRLLLPKREWQRADQPRYSGEVHTVSEVSKGRVTDDKGNTYQVAWTQPVSGEARRVEFPQALRGGDAARTDQRREAFKAFAEALRVKLGDGSLSTQEAGEYLARIPGYTAALKEQKMAKQAIRGVVALFPEFFEVQGVGGEGRVFLKGRRRITKKSPNT